MAFVDNPSYRRNGFGVRRWTAVLPVAALLWVGCVARVGGQDVYEVMAVTDGAELTGTAVFSGRAPAPRSRF